MASDLEFFSRGNNLNFVRGKAEKFEASGSCGANVFTVLADAAGEDEKIYAAEKGYVGADYFADGDGECIQRKLGA